MVRMRRDGLKLVVLQLFTLTCSSLGTVEMEEKRREESRGRGRGAV